ncbi:DUF2490 domain-containing protein [Flavobacterium sp. F52]|uniref:DUF2490 domain-containing protein n=1 Tax=Flavobacterium sp. F52 TaxID=1202532 RepID=UPI000272DBE8|nr:DUF2490 domain-containing protein [Flavobacterium sp. F52]EJG03194.1 hypothetical protein FF52_03340 [Flavobacterium sp. F52]
MDTHAEIHFLKRCWFLAVLLSVSIRAASQERQVIHQNQQWIEYAASLKMNEQYSILVDGGYRWIDNYITGKMYYIRAGVSYSLSENVSVHAGFAHVGYFFDNDNLSQIEHRPYQELSIQNKVHKIGIFQRFRVEERFFEPMSSEYRRPYNWFNWRFRYMIMFNIPLFAFSKEHPEYRMSLGIGDELLLNAGKNINFNQFDQNRFLISPTFHFGKNLSVAVTWSNQYSSTFTQNRFIHAQVFWLQVQQKFDFSNKR